MTTFVPPELIRSTGTLTVEDINLITQTGNEGTIDLVTDLAAAGDIHNLIFTGEDSLGNATAYASMVAEIVDATDGTEDGAIRFETFQAGANAEVMTLAQGLTMLGATGGDQGSGTINATAVYVNGVALSTSTGDVVGPASATDNAVARFDLTTGKLIQNSGVIIDDTNNITGVNDLTVGGNLTVNGTTTTLDTANLAVEDSLIQLARLNNATDTLDIGLVGLYDTSGAQDLYGGLFRDATDNKWKLFVDSQEDLSTASTVNIAATGYTVATLVANLEGNVTGQVSDLSNHDTDDLTEGATNKYASTTNVDAAGAVMETDFNAFTVLAADTDNTPLPLTMGASTFLARLSAGGIVAATPAQVRTELNVADGADANLTWADAVRTSGGDFTPGVSTTLTLPQASPGDAEANVRVFFNGIKQHTTEWSVSGTTITFTAAIPVGVTDVELSVLA